MPADLLSVAPVFSTDDLPGWLAHYRALGFDVEQYDDEYGFATRGTVQLQVSYRSDHDPKRTAGCAYVYVSDADALVDEWTATGLGRTHAATDTDYGLREGAHIDPSGNLLRFGSDR